MKHATSRRSFAVSRLLASILSKHCALDTLVFSCHLTERSKCVNMVYYCEPTFFAVRSISFADTICTVYSECNSMASEFILATIAMRVRKAYTQLELMNFNELFILSPEICPLLTKPFTFEYSCTSPEFDKYRAAQLYRRSNTSSPHLAAGRS